MEKLFNVIRVYRDFDERNYPEAVKTALRFLVGFHQPLEQFPDNVRKLLDNLKMLHPDIPDVFKALAFVRFLRGDLKLYDLSMYEMFGEDGFIAATARILGAHKVKLEGDLLGSFESLRNMLLTASSGTHIKDVEMVCKFCGGTGKAFGDLDCPICEGVGHIYYPNKVEVDLEDIAYRRQYKLIGDFVEKYLDDHIRYIVLGSAYKSFGCRHDMKNPTYHMYFDTFIEPLKCSFDVQGEIKTNPFDVIFEVENHRFVMKVIDVNVAIAEKPKQPKPQLKPQPKPTTETEMGHCIYTTKKGEQIIGVPIKHADINSLKKYYRCKYKGMDFIYDATKYSRDQVRQAFSHCANTHKSNISVKTYYR